MKVYISGKITGLAEKEAENNFNKAEEYLKSLGHQPVNPLMVQPDCKDVLRAPQGCNSGETFENGLYKHTWQCYMKADIIAMMNCRGIYLLQNWTDSKGAFLEVELAKGLEYEVFYEGIEYGIV